MGNSVKGRAGPRPPTVVRFVMFRANRERLAASMASPARPRRSPVRGAAMVATLAATTMVLTLATAGLLLARSDLILFQNHRDGTVTYFRAHGTAVQVVEGFPAGYGFEAFLAGPDATHGTRDDGTVSIPLLMPGCRVSGDAYRGNPRGDPFADSNPRVRLIAHCSGPRGARRDVEAIVGRDRAPFVPAALYLGRPDIEARAPIIVDGADHRPQDPPGTASGLAGPVAAVASPTLDEPLPLAAAVDAGGNPVSASPAPEIDVAAFASRALTLGPPLVAELSRSALLAPFTHALADARLAAGGRGAGLLLVDGHLEVEAPFDFTGVLVIGGTLRIATSGRLTVRGWLWVQGEGAGPLIDAGGSLTALYSSAAVASADTIFLLPRRATLLAERELS